MTAYALILARGGSKGLPRKNLRSLGGHPLIAWSIAAARASQKVEKVICSTDCQEIAEVANSYGAVVPFIRPAELASDTATDLQVFRHAVSWLADHDEHPDMLVQMRPTTPFREPKWIDSSIARMIEDQSITSIRSVTPADPTPYKMWSIGEDGFRLNPLLTLEGIAEPYNMPRQSLPTAYWHTGQIDVIRTKVIAAGSMTGDVIVALHVDRERAIDIDSIRDFHLAELVFKDSMPQKLLELLANHKGSGDYKDNLFKVCT